MIADPVVVAVYGPQAVSGVASAGASAGAFGSHHVAWRPLIVGEESEVACARVGCSPIVEAPGATFACWPSDAQAVEQVRIVRDALRSLNADVVVPNDRPHGFAAAALDHHRGVRCAAWIHADHDDGDELIERCGHLADAWRCVSPASMRRAMLRGNLNGPGGVLHAPVRVPTEPTPWRSDDGILRLLYAGRLSDSVKRVLDLAQLATILHSMNVPFRLCIAGDGPAADRLREASASHIANDRVRLLGAVDRASVLRLIDDSDLLVLVSASEGMPMAAMEAMSRGRGLALTRGCGGIVPLAEQHGCAVVADTGDMDELAAGLADLSHSPSSIRSMGLAAHAAAQATLDAPILAPKFDAFIHEAARAPSRASRMQPIERAGLIARAVSMIGPCTAAEIERLILDRPPQSISIPQTSPPETDNYICPAGRRVLHAVNQLRRNGASRIALYGAGRHTRRLGPILKRESPIVAILDDHANTLNDSIFGLPVLHPRDRHGAGIDAVIISSDEHERQMLSAAADWEIPVIPLYQPAESGGIMSPAA